MLAIIAKLFGNAKVLLGIGLLAAVAAGFVYVKHVQGELTLAQANLKTEQANEVTLNNTISQLKQAQDQDALVIKQLTDDKQAALTAANDLNTKINTSKSEIVSLKKALNNITVAPTAITPYLSQAIQGVQDRRTSRAAAPVGASQ